MEILFAAVAGATLAFAGCTAAVGAAASGDDTGPNVQAGAPALMQPVRARASPTMMARRGR